MDYFIKYRHLTHGGSQPDQLPYLTIPIAIGNTTVHNRAVFIHSHHTMPLCHGRFGLNPLFFHPTSEYTSEGVQ
jgi:hypothetical protein